MMMQDATTNQIVIVDPSIFGPALPTTKTPHHNHSKLSRSGSAWDLAAYDWLGSVTGDTTSAIGVLRIVSILFTDYSLRSIHRSSNFNLQRNNGSSFNFLEF